LELDWPVFFDEPRRIFNKKSRDEDEEREIVL
jgi:hypothetical protein